MATIRRFCLAAVLSAMLGGCYAMRPPDGGGTGRAHASASPPHQKLL
jgi:hypothetical protein